jgi:hypothetical protein
MGLDAAGLEIGAGFADATEVFRRGCREEVFEEGLALALFHALDRADNFLRRDVHFDRARHLITSSDRS